MYRPTPKTIGFVAGILVFILMSILPVSAELTAEGKYAAACAALMAIWWITEAIPLAATALLPLVLFPLFRIVPAKLTAMAYADSNIFLFLGGFLIAIAMQRHNLHKRIALKIICLLGTSPRKILLGFMLATAFLSMWISNTATTMMMVPIGIAVIEQVKAMQNGTVKAVTNQNSYKFGLALMLGIAYSSSIGGVGTLVGTPPNIIFSGMIKNMFPELPEIDFVKWLAVGIPVVVVFLPLTWFYLSYVGINLRKVEIVSGGEVIQAERDKLGPLSVGEKLTLAVFLLTSLGWIFRKDLDFGSFQIPGWAGLLDVDSFVNDSTVAMLGALLLFVLPIDLKKMDFVLNWDWAKRVPWGILILFGGGLALAKGIQNSGLDIWIGNGFQSLKATNPLFLILGICFLLTFLTEITSNTATITMFLPVLGAMSVTLGLTPFVLMIPATISTSCAFMMPVATPPNAIVFGSGYVQIKDMAKKGFFLNLMGVIIITLIMYFVAFPFLGLAFF